MGRIKKPHEGKSVIKEYLDTQASKSISEDDECFVISFKHLQANERPKFYEWEQKGILAQAVDTLANYCNRPLYQQQDSKFTIYGQFPENSSFSHPSNVPPDAKWARIHVTGLIVLAGHVFRNTFYVVFLDEDHTFYITKGADN